MAYSFTAEWIRGVLNSAPDALSRNPVSDPKPQEILAERDPSGNPDTTIAEIRTISSGQQESIRLRDLRDHTEQDHEYQQLQHLIQNGFPENSTKCQDGCN